MPPLNSSSRYASQSGFALPIVFGMGLIAILLGLITLHRAQDDRVIASNTRGSTQSQLAAESGIAQIQNFMNRYRMMANFSACIDIASDGIANDWGSDGACTNSGTTLAETSWGNPILIPNLNADCSPSNDTLAESRTAVSNWTRNSWKLVDPSDASQGEYRLVSYDGSGTLTVEGIVRRGQLGESRSLLNVRLPIFNVANEQVAGLWVQTSVSSNPAFNTDVVAACGSSVAVSLAAGKSLIRTQVPMPTAPSQPSAGTGVYNLTTAGNISGLPGSNFKPGESGQTTYITGKKLPRLIANGTGTTTDDVPDGLGVYNYIVSSIDESFEIVPGKAVNLWVTGTIDLKNKRIVNPCASAGAPASCGPFDIRIYGSGSSILLNSGTAACDVFFHLPGYAVTFSSDGSTTFDCGGGEKNTSVLWVNSWSGGSGTNNLLAPRSTWSQALNATSMAVPPPRIGAFQTWDPDS
jgi:Tfp pilus assembly protein PilX